MKKLWSALLGVIVAGAVSAALISTASAATPRTVAGPCPTDVVTMDHIVYPLDHGVYPGVVAVDMNMINGIPQLQSVCLEDGWTVEWKDATRVQLTFSYQGIRAIDFKFEPGKTDIRFR